MYLGRYASSIIPTIYELASLEYGGSTYIPMYLPSYRSTGKVR